LNLLSSDEPKKEQQAPTEGPVYECVQCGRRVSFEDLEKYISFRCPYCGYRIFRKVRAPIVKRVKAR
jgi:DNA-directed RNA polymerase subunit P